VFVNTLCIAPAPASVDPHVTPDDPPDLLQSLQERREAAPPLRIACGPRYDHIDAPHALGLLRTRGEWQHRRRTAQKRDELAPSHVAFPAGAFGTK
jgi:hypothetical protein